MEDAAGAETWDLHTTQISLITHPLLSSIQGVFCHERVQTEVSKGLSSPINSCSEIKITGGGPS